MDKLSFNILQIVEESQVSGDRFIYPNKETFKDIEEDFHRLIEGTYYEVIADDNEDFIWFSFKFGKPNPRDNHVTHVKTGEKRTNQRDTEETELLYQFFCLYNYNTNYLYISNTNKKNILKKIIHEKTDKKYTFKSIKKTADEFMSILNKVDKITFTETKNLFSQDTKRRQALVDLTGTDAPDAFTIEAEYGEQSTIKKFINRLLTEQTNHTLKDLIICGSDEDDFDVIFNNDTFTRKVDIECKKDESGKYSADEVRESLICELDL